MSDLNDAISNHRKYASDSGPAHATKSDRIVIMDRVVRLLWSVGLKVKGPQNWSLVHFHVVVDRRWEDGVSVRTIQNEVSAMRATQTEFGRVSFAKSKLLTSRGLGLPKGCRDGSKEAMSYEGYEQATIRASVVDAGLGATFPLMWAIGLRAMEALRSPSWLEQWEQDLLAGRPLTVIDGTKGGRKRLVHVIDVQEALKAVRDAIVVMNARNGVLIEGNLEKAYSRYRHWMNEVIGIQGHSLRYSFAFRGLNRYLSLGHTEEVALILVSRDLGHGDGRGKWIKQIYLQGSKPVGAGQQAHPLNRAMTRSTLIARQSRKIERQHLEEKRPRTTRLRALTVGARGVAAA